MSKIEAELLKATGIKPKAKENRQDLFDRILKKVADFDDDAWEALSEVAQKWVNKGQKVVNNDDGDIAEFPDVKGGDKDADDDRSSRGRGKDKDDKEDDKGDEDRPRNRRGGKDKDEDGGGDRRGGKDEDEGSGRRGRNRDDDKDKDDDKGDDDRGSRRSSRDKDKEEDKDDKPARGRGKDKDDDKPARGKDKGKDKPAKKGGAQVEIKKAVIQKPARTTEDIIAILEKKGLDATQSAVSTIRSGTLQTLRLVAELGMPKGDF